MKEGKKEGMSYREIHDRSGVSISHISRVMNGKRKPTIEVAMKLADAMGMPVCDFISQIQGNWEVKEGTNGT